MTLHVLSAAALVSLCAGEVRAFKRHSLEQEDATALVQLNSGLDPLGEVFVSQRNRHRDVTDFPLITFDGEEKYHFVGSAAFEVDLNAMHFHVYDIALYLKTSSPLWLAPTISKSRARKLDEMMDNVQFWIVSNSQWMNNANMARFVDRLEYFAERDGLKNYSQAIKDYKQVYYDGPKVTKGSRIVLRPGKRGVTPTVAGKDMGLVASEFIGALVIKAYLGPDSDLPEFRDNVFAQLADGKPDVVGPPALVHANATNGGAIIAVTVVIIVGAVCLCAGCLWWIIRRRSAQQPASAEKLSAEKAQS